MALHGPPTSTTSMTDPLVLTETRGSVRLLILNRPSVMNSLSAALHRQLLPALEAAAQDPGVRAVVLTGAGRAFCAGQDLADPEVQSAPGEPMDARRTIETWYGPLTARLRSMPVPVIAAVNGAAAGAGASLALGCDMVIAGRSAYFLQAFAKIGLIPDAGGTWLWPRLVGRAKALGWAITGDKLPAVEAERLGLIWQVVDDADLMATVMALADKLSAMPLRAIAETRRAIDEAMPMDFGSAVAMEAVVQGDLGRQHDFIEGVTAFMAKRPPRFTDR
jgi:2-(1,2-epoxy-1,2-dihydrophenyl)acetyl-CoA isomerase